MQDARTPNLEVQLRHALGMPEDHPRLDELRRWAACWQGSLNAASTQGIWSQLSDMARQELIEAISVPESFFWRYPSQLQRVVARVRQAPVTEKVLIWSACCAGGEEPYTLAIMLAEAGLLERVELVATDINRQKLDQAREGRFSDRSVRPVPAPLTTRWFEHQSGLHPWQIHARLREAVRFEYLDLLAFARGTVPPPVSAPHIILCRNALIYFDKNLQAQIVDAFYRTSCTGSWLLLGHSERLPLTQTQWRLCTARDHAWYEKDTRPRHRRSTPTTATPVRKPASAGLSTGPARSGSPSRPTVSRPVRKAPEPMASKSSGASLAESLRQARSATDPSATIQACRRALYLDPDCIEAHWLMIQAAEASGQTPLMTRHGRLLRHLLASLPERTMLSMDTPVSVADLKRALDRLEGHN